MVAGKEKINTNYIKENVMKLRKKEKAILVDAITRHKGYVPTPANDEDGVMATLTEMYDKKLLSLDYERDCLVVNEFGKDELAKS